MVRSAQLTVLAAEGPLRRELEPLPDGAVVVGEPGAEVEFAVIGIELMRRLPGLLAQLPGLAVIQSVFAGADAILPIVPDGVVVCTAQGVHDLGVSEWIVMMILALRRRLPTLLEFQRSGVWQGDINSLTATGPSPLEPAAPLDGSLVVVLGYGSIGRAVARRLEPFGARIAGIARHAREDAQPPEALAELLPAADVVVLLAPLTPETEGIVDAAFLARMKPGALLINASRGRLVDTNALLEALRSGRIAAALDVTDPEPLPAGHPLWSAPNLIVTPHIAGGVSGWEARAHRLAGEQLRRYAAGVPLLNVVTAPAVDGLSRRGRS
jgi:phosphoglycerate dehydrogenase-like enzyme